MVAGSDSRNRWTAVGPLLLILFLLFVVAGFYGQWSWEYQSVQCKRACRPLGFALIRSDLMENEDAEDHQCYCLRDGRFIRLNKKGAE